ncbi:MAG TPA: hypothetical protein VF192_11465 [Longimicrobiales bacterium]
MTKQRQGEGVAERRRWSWVRGKAHSIDLTRARGRVTIEDDTEGYHARLR